MAFERRGDVELAVDSNLSKFQFCVSADDDSLRIWLEDSVSKEQWQTKGLAISDFVTVDKRLRHAYRRLPSVSVPLTLVSVPLEPIDLLASRVAELEKATATHRRELETRFSDQVRELEKRLGEQIRALQRENGQLKRQLEEQQLHAMRSKKIICARATLKDNAKTGASLVWTGNSTSVAFEADGAIRIVVAGTYFVLAHVVHMNSAHNSYAVELYVNGAIVHWWGDHTTKNYACSTPICAAVEAKPGDKLVFKYQGVNWTFKESSRLMVFRLG